jgi:hypothetical protein
MHFQATNQNNLAEIKDESDSTKVAESTAVSQQLAQFKRRRSLARYLLSGRGDHDVSMTSPNLRGRLEMTPLMLLAVFARESHLVDTSLNHDFAEFADLLIVQAGAKLDLVDERGLTALHYAAANNDLVAWLLICHGATPTPHGSSVPTLHAAILPGTLSDSRVINYLVMHNNMAQVFDLNTHRDSNASDASGSRRSTATAVVDAAAPPAAELVNVTDRRRRRSSAGTSTTPSTPFTL